MRQGMAIPTLCKFDKLVSTSELSPHPRNRNTHPKQQIEILGKVLRKLGIRRPLIVSNLSGHIVSGHGLLESLKGLGVEKAPVVFQDFKNEQEEYNFLIADNETQRHSRLDLNTFYDDIKELDFEENIDLNEFGLEFNLNEDTVVEGAVYGEEEEDEETKGRAETRTLSCPNCGEKFEL